MTTFVKRRFTRSNTTTMQTLVGQERLPGSGLCRRSGLWNAYALFRQVLSGRRI